MGRNEREFGRRGFLRTLLVGTAGTALFGCAGTTGRAGSGRRPPNIILVLADDLGYGDIGCYGQRRFRTPHLDRMAGEGVRFTQFYAGAPICAPSRNALLQGLHTGHTKVRWNKDPWISGDRPTFADALRSRGYATGAFGKWALGLAGTPSSPTRNGFDRFFGYLDQVDAHRHFPDHLWENDEKVPLGPEPVFAHHRIMDEALRFVRENGDRPFLLYLPFTLPHPDLVVPEDVVAPFRGRYPEIPFIPESEDEEYAAQEAPRAVYASMISLVDRDMGRLFALLREMGIDGETVVLFTSDNGPGRRGGADPEFFESTGSLRGLKASLHEGGIRVPMIARWPGVLPGGGTSDHVWALPDLFPTFTDIAGAEAPGDIDGLSMAPLLRGRRAPEHEYLYWEFLRGGRYQAVRLGKWKAIRSPRGAVELYDLESDPGENSDVADGRPEIVARCVAAMEASHTQWIPHPTGAGIPGSEGNGAR